MPEAQGIKLGRHDVTGETRKIGYGSSRILGSCWGGDRRSARSGV